MFYVLKSSDVLDILVPILYYLNDARADQCKYMLILSTLVISKSKGLYEIFRNIHTSTYQICRIEEKINQTTTFHK